MHPSISNTPIPANATDLATVCILCSHNCGLRVDVEDGNISAVRADKSNPITHGYICNKAMSVPYYADHAQRVQHPLKRREDGTFEQINWTTALDEIAVKFKEIHGAHGPRSVSLVGIGGQANHLDGPYGISWLGAMGSKRWFNAFAQEKTQHFLVGQWMFDSAPAVFFHPDLDNTDFLLMMGTNPKISNRGHNPNETFRKLAKDESTKIAIVDPRETETTRIADWHLRANPGSDAYLLLAILKTIVDSDDLLDQEFVDNKTTGLEELRSSLGSVDLALMSAHCGISLEEIQSLTRAFATSEKASIMFDLAVEQIPFSTLVSYLIHTICIITGNVGKEGGMIFGRTQSPPEWSPKRFEEPERALASGIQAISALGGFGMFSPTLVPEEIMLDHPERIRAMIVEGSNPYLSFSDTKAWKEARKQLDLMVVIDPAMTETAWDADYVLPVPTGYEKWEWSGFPKGFPRIHAQLRPPVLPAKGDVLPESEIYVSLMERLGLIPEPPTELAELAPNALTADGALAFFAKAQELSAGNQATMLGWTYRLVGPHMPSPALTAVLLQCMSNAFQRPQGVATALGVTSDNPFELATASFQKLLDHPEGTLFVVEDFDNNLDDNIGYEDKKVRLAPAPMLSEIGRAAETSPETDPNYPFVLAAGLRTSWTANTIQRDPNWRKGRGPHCTLHLSTEDANTLGIEDGTAVRVSTRRGSVTLPAEIDKKVMAGHMWIPNGMGMIMPNSDPKNPVLDGVNTNELTDTSDRDPISGCPHTKYTLCNVARVAAEAAAE